MQLLRLTIEEFGLIERAEITFADGLTVFTGETGSGKTMLLGALDFVLGARTGSEMVRGGAQRARISLEYEPDGDDEAVVIVRELNVSGRSSARVNGVAASAGELRALGEGLVESIGQHEAQRLLVPAYQLDLLDRFGGDVVAEVAGRVRTAHERYAQIAAELEALRVDEGEALATLDFARFALAEIEAIAPEAGEDERLRERRDVLANAERISAALSAAHEAIEGEGGAIDALGTASAALGGITRYSTKLSALAEQLAAVQSEAGEIALEVGREVEAVQVDPGELETVGARLEAVERLKKKHGGTLAGIAEAGERFARTIDRFESRDERLVQLERTAGEARSALEAVAKELHERRAETARTLEAAVEAELEALAMPAARVRVALEPLDRIGPGGADRCEVLLAPNPGEEARSLAKSASGGELSRVLLALTVVLADRRERTALVFDEVDAGIGGATANAVALRLGRLAQGAQIILVTHLAQIASWADGHYALRKRERAGATTVEALSLDADERRAEIARMLAGDTREVALDHAGTMLRDVASRRAKGAAWRQ
jgi:DNA repair protein RecN (Recombination protein N)